MRKQIAYDFRNYAVGPKGELPDHIALSREVQKYLDQGWEVLNNQVIHHQDGIVFVAVSYVKYEDVPTAEPPAAETRKKA